jgi:hypothetical protein
MRAVESVSRVILTKITISAQNGEEMEILTNARRRKPKCP